MCIVERRRVEGRTQEWNISREELQVQLTHSLPAYWSVCCRVIACNPLPATGVVPEIDLNTDSTCVGIVFRMMQHLHLPVSISHHARVCCVAIAIFCIQAEAKLPGRIVSVT